MAKYDETVVPMRETLAQLGTFLDGYVNFIQVELPPVYLPRENKLCIAFRMRVTTKTAWDEALPFMVKADLLEKPANTKKAQRGNVSVQLTENDVLTRRWAKHIEHLISFILESPEALRMGNTYRTLVGYLSTGGSSNVAETIAPQVERAMKAGNLGAGATFDIFQKALPRGN